MREDKRPVSQSTDRTTDPKRRPGRSFLARWWWLALMLAAILCLLVVLKIASKRGTGYQSLAAQLSQTAARPYTTSAAPDTATDLITWTLPDCASTTRLVFPYALNDVFYDLNTGLTGYGVHAGQHIEGLDHVWVVLKQGTQVLSWGAGTIVNVVRSGDVELGEYHITVEYGDGLYGIHMEVKQPLVAIGDAVTAGQVVGVGLDFTTPDGELVTSGEFALVDLNRHDGVYDFFDSTSTVSPYDYLQAPEKASLVAAYQEHVLAPYQAGEQVSSAFYPYQPYLTNTLFLHTPDMQGRLSGEWYSTRSDPQGDKRDCLTFIEAANPYFTGNLVLSRNDNLPDPYSGIQGTFTVDYATNRIVLTDRNSNGQAYYGIFQIDESGAWPTLKIEWQEGSYPQDFSADAMTYILRNNGVDSSSGK